MRREARRRPRPRSAGGWRRRRRSAGTCRRTSGAASSSLSWRRWRFPSSIRRRRSGSSRSASCAAASGVRRVVQRHRHLLQPAGDVVGRCRLGGARHFMAASTGEGDAPVGESSARARTRTSAAAATRRRRRRSRDRRARRAPVDDAVPPARVELRLIAEEVDPPERAGVQVGLQLVRRVRRHDDVPVRGEVGGGAVPLGCGEPAMAKAEERGGRRRESNGVSIPARVAGTTARREELPAPRRRDVRTSGGEGAGGANSLRSFAEPRGSEKTSSCSASTWASTGERRRRAPGAPRSATDHTFELLSASSPQTATHALVCRRR